MLRIAYFSPLPPQRSGVADYSADLLPHLSKEADITLYVSTPSTVPPELSRRFSVREMSRFSGERWRYDIALYQMGNSLFHTEQYARLRRNPGLTVLHDYTLHHFVASVTAGRGDFSAYVREMAYSKGRHGVARAFAIQRGESQTPLFDWPLNERVVDLSIGVLVHSDYVRRRLLSVRPLARVQRINQPIPLPAKRDQMAVRCSLHLPADAFIMLTCGQVTPEKRLDLVWQAFAAFRERHRNTLWLQVGEMPSERAGWEREMQKSDLRSSVRQMGYVDGLQSFYDCIAASDVCINLRDPTAGETSASLLRSMAMGRPVIVSDVGWYSELPDSCCGKISHDGTEVEQIRSILGCWYADSGARMRVGAEARAHIGREHDPDGVARDYASFIQETILS